MHAQCSCSSVKCRASSWLAKAYRSEAECAHTIACSQCLTCCYSCACCVCVVNLQARSIQMTQPSLPGT
jgi:hypothetical protein